MVHLVQNEESYLKERIMWCGEETPLNNKADKSTVHIEQADCPECFHEALKFGCRVVDRFQILVAIDKATIKSD